MKYINILILFLIFNCSNNKTKSNDKNTIEHNLDTLRYSYNGFNNGLLLDLLSDGRFVNENYLFSCFGGGKRKKVFGTYKIDSINLTLIPERIELIEYPEDMQLKPVTTKVKYGIDSLKIKTEFQIFTWETNKYLFSDVYDFGWHLEKENDYIRFAYYVNSGFEPETSGMYLVNKTKDSVKSGFNLNQIPSKWQEHFLKAPISAKIKSIKKIINQSDSEHFWWQIELDKGENDGMNNHLTMTTEDNMLFIDIDSVLNNRSFGQYHMPDFMPKKFPIGTELKTKWK